MLQRSLYSGARRFGTHASSPRSNDKFQPVILRSLQVRFSTYIHMNETCVFSRESRYQNYSVELKLGLNAAVPSFRICCLTDSVPMRNVCDSRPHAGGVLVMHAAQQPQMPTLFVRGGIKHHLLAVVGGAYCELFLLQRDGKVERQVNGHVADLEKIGKLYSGIPKQRAG